MGHLQEGLSIIILQNAFSIAFYIRILHIIMNCEMNRLFDVLWHLYKCRILRQVPAMTLIANMIWFPNEYLLIKCPQMANHLDKKALHVVTQHRQTWLSQKVAALPK